LVGDDRVAVVAASRPVIYVTTGIIVAEMCSALYRVFVTIVAEVVLHFA
jgi:hypothetical protein